MTPMDLLSGAGYVLDSPGAWLRAAIGNIGDTISGQDRTGWRASGREMLEAFGLGKNKDGIDPGDVAGFLAEMVLDPLNLVPFGAMYKGGSKLAKMATKAGPRWQHTVPPIENMEHLIDMTGLKDIGQYVPPGSRWLGEGAEASVIGTPSGRALRFSHGDRGLAYAEPRINADPLLQPSHTVHLPIPDITSQYRSMVENVPEVQPLDSAVALAVRDRLDRLKSGDIPQARMNSLRNRAPSDVYVDDHAVDYWVDRANGIDAQKEIAAFRNGPAGAPFNQKTPFQWREASDPANNIIPPKRNRSFTEGVDDDWGPESPSDVYGDMARALVQDTSETGDRIIRALHKRAMKSGFLWGDDHLGNAAIMGRRAKILDPGFMDNIAELPLAPATEHANIGRIGGFLADRLGYTDMVRNQWEGLPSVDPTIRNALLAAPSAGAANATFRQFLPQQY